MWKHELNPTIQQSVLLRTSLKDARPRASFMSRLRPLRFGCGLAALRSAAPKGASLFGRLQGGVELESRT